MSQAIVFVRSHFACLSRSDVKGPYARFSRILSSRKTSPMLVGLIERKPLGAAATAFHETAGAGHWPIQF